MQLRMHIEEIHIVDYSDLEAFFESLYGKRPEIVAMEESRNDTSLSFNVTGKIENWDTSTVEELLATGYSSFGTQVMLDYLCQEGHIPTGSYLIKISW